MRGARATTIGLLEGLMFDKILCPSDQHSSNFLPLKIIRVEPQGLRRFAGLIRGKKAPATICRKAIEAQKNKSGEIGRAEACSRARTQIFSRAIASSAAGMIDFEY